VPAFEIVIGEEDARNLGSIRAAVLRSLGRASDSGARVAEVVYEALGEGLGKRKSASGE
jgi:hypothetical protein